jgi:hypothetical protein
MSKISPAKKTTGGETSNLCPLGLTWTQKEEKFFCKVQFFFPKTLLLSCTRVLCKAAGERISCKSGDNDLNAEAGTPLSRSAA